MPRYVFTGDRQEKVGTDYVFTRRGQIVEIEDPAEASALIAEGMMLVPENEFVEREAPAVPAAPAEVSNANDI